MNKEQLYFRAGELNAALKTMQSALNTFQNDLQSMVATPVTPKQISNVTKLSVKRSYTKKPKKPKMVIVPYSQEELNELNWYASRDSFTQEELKLTATKMKRTVGSIYQKIKTIRAKERAKATA